MEKSVDNVVFLFFGTLISLALLGTALWMFPAEKPENTTPVTVCVEGVEYIQNITSHGFSVLTAKIDSETLTYTRCQ